MKRKVPSASFFGGPSFFGPFQSRRRISHAFGGERESPTCAAIKKQPSPPARKWRGILHSCWLSPKGLLSERKGRANRLFSEELEQWGRGSHKSRKKGGGRAPKANGPFFPFLFSHLFQTLMVLSESSKTNIGRKHCWGTKRGGARQNNIFEPERAWKKNRFRPGFLACPLLSSSR